MKLVGEHGNSEVGKEDKLMRGAGCPQSTWHNFQNLLLAKQEAGAHMP